MTDVLISPLGRSPGAVSGVFFALRERGYAIDKVITVGTSHADVITAANGYLGPIFEYLNVEYDPIHLPEQELRSEKRSVMPYVGMTGLVIQNAITERGKQHIHVAVTGGRSGMGALAALATQLYGGHKLWHLWVPAEIEERGTVNFLNVGATPEKMCTMPSLNPTIWGPEAWDLVDLPFIDLSPLHEDLKLYWHTGQLPENKRLLSDLLANIGVQNIFKIFPAGMTFEQAGNVLQLAAKYKTAGSAEDKDLLQMELVDILQRSGVVEREDKLRLLNMLRTNGNIDEILAVISKDRTGFWKWVREHKDEIGISINTLTFLLANLTLWFQVSGLIK